jgi:hypothetical protein
MMLLKLNTCGAAILWLLGLHSLGMATPARANLKNLNTSQQLFIIERVLKGLGEMLLSIIGTDLQQATHLMHSSRVGRMTTGKLNAELGTAMMHVPFFHAILCMLIFSAAIASACFVLVLAGLEAHAERGAAEQRLTKWPEFMGLHWGMQTMQPCERVYIELGLWSGRCIPTPFPGALRRQHTSCTAAGWAE